ncbi:hypothetical protein GCM10023168_13750 [Fodinibacter luteus]|uniref:Uncharacterized protein n=1 Tax=Fodinibacter luteus TaxID=552064 RepID=A0ABP8KAN7_9MICO
MGFSTRYLGFLEITPHLNPAEVEWLSGFADWGGLPDGDPLRLPMNPRASVAKAFEAGGGALSPPRNIPRGVHDWRVCAHGDRIAWRASEKSNDAVQTLTFLVGHYLGPDAVARRSDNPDFAEFTFDHRLDGVIAGERDDTDELFLLRVTDSRITQETLVAGVPAWLMPEALEDW